MLALMLLGTAASAQTTPSFTFDPDAYVRLRVRVTADSSVSEGVFGSKFCPDKSAFDLNLGELLQGDRTASLVLSVSAPTAAPVELNLFDIERKGGGIFSGPRCRLGLNRIDYKSPLYLAAQFNDQTVQVGLTFADQKGTAQLFADGLGGFLAIANAIAPLPAALLREEDGMVSRVTDGLVRKTKVSETVFLNIGTTGDSSKIWRLTSSVRPDMPKLTINAYLENVGSYFTKPSIGWDPALLLAAPFPPNPKVTASDFATYLASLGTDYSSFVSANDLGSFNARCDALRTNISKLGFSPMDRSLLLWAAAQSQSVMRNNKAIDRTDCMRTTYAELAQFDTTKSIVEREQDPPAAPATEAQMRLSIEANERLAIFMQTGDLAQNRQVADELFAWPLEVVDEVQAATLTSPAMQLSNADQWENRRTDRTKAIASRVGCYLFLPGETAGASRVLFFAAINTTVGNRDTLVELRFAPTPPDTERSRINRIVLRSEGTVPGDIALMKARFAGGCGLSGWRPALLD